jgi:hypothetical protein
MILGEMFRQEFLYKVLAMSDEDLHKLHKSGASSMALGFEVEGNFIGTAMEIVCDEIKRRNERPEWKDVKRKMAIGYCKTLSTNTPYERVNLFNTLRKQVRLDVLEDRYEMAKETIDKMYELIVEVKGLDKQFGVGEIRQMKE